jgi:hypothetical protein
VEDAIAEYDGVEQKIAGKTRGKRVGAVGVDEVSCPIGKVSEDEVTKYRWKSDVTKQSTSQQM